MSCPVCNADVPMDGDERPGAEVVCTYCNAPLSLAASAEDPSELQLEEDF